MSYDTLKIALEGELAILTLNRPEKRNAISLEMVEELYAALEELAAGSARVVILTGEGKAFCAGMDLGVLKRLASQTPEQHLADSRRTARTFRSVWSFPKPLIAAVNGPAIAGGCLLASLCDFALAVPEAAFGYTEVRVGFIPAMVTIFLERQLGEKKARDLLLSGRIFDAAEACELGLVNRVVPSANLMAEARELAATLIAHSPGSLRVTKRLLVQPAEAEVDARLELSIAESAVIRSTADFHEGLSAFLEKRKPRWTGR